MKFYGGENRKNLYSREKHLDAVWMRFCQKQLFNFSAEFILHESRNCWSSQLELQQIILEVRRIFEDRRIGQLGFRGRLSEIKPISFIAQFLNGV